MNSIFRAEIRAEAGYDATKDFTYIRTNSPDFTEQIVFRLGRDSEEDVQVRTFLETNRIVDFAELAKTVTLPSLSHPTFGIVGNEEDTTLTPEHYPHLVLFGRATSGAHNLIRFWLLWAVTQNMHIISVANPDLYGVETFLNPSLVHHLQPDQLLREQIDELGFVDDPNSRTLILIGSGFEPDFDGEDAELIGHVQNRLGRFRSKSVFSFVHLRPLHEHVRGMEFFGSEGDPEHVSYGAIGDVNERTARVVGSDVPLHNRRGVAWLKRNGTKETKRVRTFLVPKPYFEELQRHISGE